MVHQGSDWNFGNGVRSEGNGGGVCIFGIRELCLVGECLSIL